MEHLKETVMDEDRIAGMAENVAGRVREAASDFAGDAKRQAEGVARKAAGAAQDAYGQAQDQARTAAAAVSGSVQQQPLLSLLIAGAVGAAITLLLARR